MWPFLLPVSPPGTLQKLLTGSAPSSGTSPCMRLTTLMFGQWITSPPPRAAPGRPGFRQGLPDISLSSYALPYFYGPASNNLAPNLWSTVYAHKYLLAHLSPTTLVSLAFQLDICQHTLPASWSTSGYGRNKVCVFIQHRLGLCGPAPACGQAPPSATCAAAPEGPFQTQDFWDTVQMVFYPRVHPQSCQNTPFCVCDLITDLIHVVSPQTSLSAQSSHGTNHICPGKNPRPAHRGSSSRAIFVTMPVSWGEFLRFLPQVCIGT